VLAVTGSGLTWSPNKDPANHSDHARQRDLRDCFDEEIVSSGIDAEVREPLERRCLFVDANACGERRKHDEAAHAAGADVVRGWTGRPHEQCMKQLYRC